MIKRLSAILIILVVSASLLTAQQTGWQRHFDGTRWTDGNVMYVAELRADGTVNMAGGTLHEGGYAFGLRCTDADPDIPSFSLIKGTFFDCEPVLSLRGAEGNSVETYQLDDDMYLLVNDKHDNTIDVLRRMRDDEDLRSIAENLQRCLYAGTYTVVSSQTPLVARGSLVHIGDDEIELGKYAHGEYEVLDSFECPTNIFRFSSGKTIELRFCAIDGDLHGGLHIYESHYRQNSDEWQASRLLLTLRREACPYAVEQQYAGRWTETAWRILLPAEVTALPRQFIRVMRNEIFARHGWHFSSADLRQYFGTEGWYEADPDPDVNNKVHFSRQEQINIQLIKSIEADAHIYTPELE